MPDSAKNWATDVILWYKQGYSDAEVAAAMNTTMRQFNTQLADNPTFAQLVEHGRTLSLAWWESQARINLNNKSFNTPLWVFNMKNKYGWADKVETTSTNENLNMSLDSLRSDIDRKLKRLYKDNAAGLTAAQEVLQPVNPLENEH